MYYIIIKNEHFRENIVKPSSALALSREKVRQVITGSRLENPRIFGSVLHGTDSETSDLDLLIDAPEGTTLFDILGLEGELESILGVPVELLTPQDISAKFRSAVLAEAQPL